MSKETSKPIENNNLGIAIFIWSAILIGCFVYFSRDEFGQFSSSFSNAFSGSLVGSDGFFASLAGFAIALSIFLSWIGLGSLAAKFLNCFDHENASVYTKFAYKATLGAGLWSLIWFFFGVFGIYNKFTGLFAVVIGLALFFTYQKISLNVGKSESTLLDKILFGVICIPVLLALINSLAPPTAKDTLLYHFAVPKQFLLQGTNVAIDGNIASFLALGTEMHSVWAMSIGSFFSQRSGEAAAGALIFSFFPLLLAMIYGWTSELGLSKNWRITAVLMFATIPTAFHVAANSYIDLSLAMYITLAIYSLGNWWKTQERVWLSCIAVFLGFALATKLTALFVFVAFALIILLRAREAKNDESANPNKIFGNGFLALIIGGILASPWYIKTWINTGSPIFPFYMNLLKGTANGWDIERSSLFQLVNTQYGGANKTIFDYLLTPLKISIFAKPEEAAFYDGIIGVGFLIGLPILIWAIWKFSIPSEIKIGLAVCLIIFLFWLFSSEQLRYLLPIFPMLAIGICFAGRELSEKLKFSENSLQIPLRIACAFGLIISATWFFHKNPLRVVFGGETKDEYLSRNVDYYPYYKILNNETPDNSKVWLINMRRDSYNIERPYFSDYMFEDWTLKKLVAESKTADEVRKKAKEMGVNYVLTRHDSLLDYKISVIVDDLKPKQENLDKLKITEDFIFDKANQIKADKRFSLVKIQ
jgi:hypothetical protein